MRSASLANGPAGRTVWDFVDWREANRIVTNLRQRIFRAARANDQRKVRSLQKLMLRSRSNILMSVRRVTQVNAGRNTPGMDKVLVKTRIVHLTEGFDFLSFNIRHYPHPQTARSGYKLCIKPSKKAVLGKVAELRDEWLALRGHRVEAVLWKLNPI